MAIPTRIDRARIDRATNPVRTLGRRPIVLARLPHVGAAHVEAELRVEGRELRVERQEADLAGAALSHGHSPEPQSRSHRRVEHVSELRESPPPKMVRTPSPPTGLSATLFTLHTRMAPFSGAIVTLALIASACLLYWMIVSPSRMSADFHDAFQDGFEANTAELPKFAPQLPSFTSRTTTGVPETAAQEMPKWDFVEGATKVSLAPLEEGPEARLQEEELAVTLEEPAIDPPAKSTPVIAPEQTARPVEGPAFPTTNHPTALDFAKLGAGGERR